MPFKDKDKEREYRRKKYALNIEKERERQKEKHKKNPGKSKKRWEKWYFENKEKRKDYCKKYYKSNREFLIVKSREKASKERVNLLDNYIKHIIKEQIGLNHKKIDENPKIKDTYRQQVKLNRLIKEKYEQSKKTK